MQQHDINGELPQAVKPPLRFREPGGKFEGEVNNPKGILEKFEPVDVLEGAIELVDVADSIVTIHCSDRAVLDSNKYPSEYQGITYTVTPAR